MAGRQYETSPPILKGACGLAKSMQLGPAVMGTACLRASTHQTLSFPDLFPYPLPRSTCRAGSSTPRPTGSRAGGTLACHGCHT